MAGIVVALGSRHGSLRTPSAAMQPAIRLGAMAILLLLVGVLVILLVGGMIVGLTLELLGFIIVGLVVGGLARLLVPGPQALGLLATVLVGIGGSLVGGLVADAFGFGSILRFVIAVGAAAVVIAIFGAAAPRSRTT